MDRADSARLAEHLEKPDEMARRIARRVEATIRFLSVEPLLAPMVRGLDLDGIGWVIGGGESRQPRYTPRPCDPDWMPAVRDLCRDAGVPFFLKQWGAWPNNPTPLDRELAQNAKGGATLDGRLWHEFPVGRATGSPLF